MFQRILIYIFFGLAGSALVVQAKNISFGLFAQGLSGCDPLNYCDPYVKIFFSSKTSDWKQIGLTQTVNENDYPIWPDVFVFDHIENNREVWEFQVWDSDYDADDLMGTAKLNVDDFVAAIDNSLNPQEVEFSGKGKLFIRPFKV